MKKVFRYELDFSLNKKGYLQCELEVPLSDYKNTKDCLLKLDVIRDVPSIWFLVDTSVPKQKVNICCFGTGWDIPDEFSKENYLGSFIIDGAEIYHCFTR